MAIPSTSYANCIREYGGFGTTVDGIAGRDFEVLTLKAPQNWFERWIFPKEFSRALQSRKQPNGLPIGYLRRCSPLSESQWISARDPMEMAPSLRAALECDKIYKVAGVLLEREFFKECETELAFTTLLYDRATHRYKVRFNAGFGSMELDLTEESHEPSPYNSVLSLFFKP